MSTNFTPARIGVVTVSDRASAGIYEDRGGPAITSYLTQHLTSPWISVARLVADESDIVSGTLIELADIEGCCLIVTTGGTGPAPRDVTPEATIAVCDRLLPGFGERMRAVSVGAVPTAILSRQLAGTRGSSLILTLPGKPAAIEECLSAVFAAIPYCIDLIGGPRFESTSDAPTAFRPTGA